MCAGAIVHARIKSAFIGAEDEKYGACGTVLNVCGNERLNHVPIIEFGILREEASLILKEFFKGIRKGA
jgi:tRNA(adenine34) deaminase